MFKPAELLYPTWIRLRENLYRFDKRRRDAWDADITERISADLQEKEPDKLRLLRQRLRQLTLELQESALRFNRLNEERAAVTREVIDFGVLLAVRVRGIVGGLFDAVYLRHYRCSVDARIFGGGHVGWRNGRSLSRRSGRPETNGCAKKFKKILKAEYAFACVRGIRRCVTGGCCSVVRANFSTPRGKNCANGVFCHIRIWRRIFRPGVEGVAVTSDWNSRPALVPGRRIRNCPAATCSW